MLAAGSFHLQDNRGHWIPSSRIKLVDRKQREGVKRKYDWSESFVPEGAKKEEKGVLRVVRKERQETVGVVFIGRESVVMSYGQERLCRLLPHYYTSIGTIC